MSKPKHEEPSAESVRAIPERKPTRWAKGRGPEAVANARRFVAAVRGRPVKGQEAVGTSTRTLRLPNNVWEELEELAREKEFTLHTLLRYLIAEALYTTPHVPPHPNPGKRVPARTRPALQKTSARTYGTALAAASRRKRSRAAAQ